MKKRAQANPVPRDEYELGITWLAERSGLSRKKVRGMLDIVPVGWPRLDLASGAGPGRRLRFVLLFGVAVLAVLGTLISSTIASRSVKASSCTLATHKDFSSSAVDNDWFNPNNWSPSGVPGPSDNVCVANPIPGGGALLIATGATAEVNSLEIQRPLTVTNGSLLLDSTTQGSLVQSGVTFTVSGGTFGGSGTLTDNGTFLWDGSSVLSGAGTLVSTGTITINDASNPFIRILSAGYHLDIAGTGTWSGLDDIGIDNVSSLKVDGTFNIVNDQSLYQYSGVGGVVVVAAGGTLAKTAGTGTSNISLPITNNGTVAITSGIVGAYTYSQSSGGTLAVRIGGTTLGTGYSQLAGSGPATIDGTLKIMTDPAFSPSAGQTFQVLTYGSRTGSFSTVVNQQISLTLQYALHYDDLTPSSLMLRVESLSGMPLVTIQPTDQTVIAGTTATFLAGATGNPTPTVQWQVSTDGGVTFADLVGATSTTLTIPNTTLGMTGNKYLAVFTNSAGSALSSAATLTVNTIGPVAPVVTTQPTDQTVTAGATAAFTAAASGNPTPAVQWQVSSDGGTTFTDLVGATSTTLTIPNTAVAMSGNKYRAVFTNSAGTVTTNAATLTVNAPPVVTTQPTNLTVTAGATATFTAAASGKPTPTVQWQVSTNGGTTFTDLVGATSTTLTIANTTVAMSGSKYRAVFTNSVGSATSNAATLTVNPPAIITQPTDQTVTAGATATFTSSASGSPTPTVQWQVSTNGGVTFTDLAGATSTTLTIPNTTVAMSGNKYRAVFTNTAGTATSNAAALTVNPATGKGPKVTRVSPRFGLADCGSTRVRISGANLKGAMSVQFGSKPAVSFQVRSDGLIVAVAPAAPAGTVDITVTTPNGTSPKSSADRFTYRPRNGERHGAGEHQFDGEDERDCSDLSSDRLDDTERLPLRSVIAPI